MDVLCSDKTGTLTENRVEVIRHVDLEDKNQTRYSFLSILNSRFQTGLRSPMDEAILKHEEVNTDQYQKVDEIPFDFIRKRLSVVVKIIKRILLLQRALPKKSQK